MKKLTLLFTIIVSVQISLSAQERTHMPYSVYGLGDIIPKGFARNLAMGRTGLAMSSPAYLNTLNPASYHNIDSVSFFFDFGFTGNFVKYRTLINGSQHGKDYNIGNLAIGFRITPNWTSGFGIMPFSSVGYKVQTTQGIEGSPNEEFAAVITGSGGLNQFYWQNSYELFDHISLGVGFTYLFGSIQKREKVISSNLARPILVDQTSYMNRLYADFGLQGWFKLNKNLNVTLGAVFGNNHGIKIRDRITVSEEEGSIAQDEITRRGTFDFPLYAGAGFSVVYKNSLTITGDYIYNDWSNASNITAENLNFEYRSNNVFRLGAEVIPGRYAKLGYFGGIAYRAGAYYEESYLKIKDRVIPEYGITAGVGLPFLSNRTSFNISYNYGIRGTLENNLIKENFHSVMVSLTLHDWWFLKRKID